MTAPCFLLQPHSAGVEPYKKKQPPGMGFEETAVGGKMGYPMGTFHEKRISDHDQKGRKANCAFALFYGQMNSGISLREKETPYLFLKIFRK